MSIWNPENLSSWIVKIEQGTRYTTPRLTNLYAAFGLCLTLSNNTIRFRSPRDIGGRRCSGLRNYELGGLKNIITGETHHAVARSYFHAVSRFDSGIKNACAIKGAQDNVVNLAVTLTKHNCTDRWFTVSPQHSVAHDWLALCLVSDRVVFHWVL